MGVTKHPLESAQHREKKSYISLQSVRDGEGGIATFNSFSFYYLLSIFSFKKKYEC